MRIDWAEFQAYFENPPENLAVKDEEAVHKCVDKLTSAIQVATAAPASKYRPRADPGTPLPACIQDEIRLKNLLRRQWQITWAPALTA
jgi:hypothetical protein